MMTKINSHIISLTFIYILAVALRLILALQLQDNPLYMLENSFISIYTPDAALYAHYANLLLNSMPHTSDVNLIEYIIYYLVKLTPFSLDEVLFFAPAFLSSLIVIPVYLILSLYVKSRVIISLSAIIASMGYGFYTRTHLGYFDTDLLNISFPLMILYSMLQVVGKNNYKYLVLVVLFDILFFSWYHSSLAIIIAQNGFFILYALFKYLKLRYAITILALISATLAYTVKLSDIMFHIDRYVFKAEILKSSGYKFTSPMQYVSEALSQNIDLTIRFLSGDISILILSLLGYVLLSIRHKEFILALPLLALGLLSFKIGIRFHIYAVPILVIGFAYFIYAVQEKLSKYKFATLGANLTLLLFLLPIYENYSLIKQYNTINIKPVFNSTQVKALQNLKEIAKPTDFVVTWWDFGWPIWYYTGMKTMIDNGMHHEDNFTVSKILLSSSQTFSHNAIDYLYDLYATGHKPAILKAIRLKKSYQNLEKELSSKNFKHKKKVDKYLVLPQDTTSTLNTIENFSNFDIKTGKKFKNHIFVGYNIIKETKSKVYLTSNTIIDKQKKIIIQVNKNIKLIKEAFMVKTANNKKYIQKITPRKTGLYVVFLDNKVYIMDDFFYNSTYIQLMFFNNYNKKYFKPLHIGKTISIYKVL